MYKRVNARKPINTETIQQELKQEISQEKPDIDTEDTYQKTILADVSKKKDPT